MRGGGGLGGVGEGAGDMYVPRDVGGELDSLHLGHPAW